MKAYQIVFDLVYMLGIVENRRNRRKWGVVMVHMITWCPLLRNGLGRCYKIREFLQNKEYK